MRHPHEKYGKKVIEMMQCFNAAIQKSGGAIWSAESLRKMTAEDLMLELANNNVRFVYDGPELKKP